MNSKEPSSKIISSFLLRLHIKIIVYSGKTPWHIYILANFDSASSNKKTNLGNRKIMEAWDGVKLSL